MRKISVLLNLMIFVLAVLFGGLLFWGEKVGYSNMVEKVEKMTPIFDNYYFAPDKDELWNFMYLATNEELNMLENIEIEEVVEKEAKAKKISAEDPSKIVKKQEKLKGVSKETTAKQEVQRYETNETSLGIDVSTWQGKIDWAKVKKSGISFAMIRAGFRGTVSGQISKDAWFERNIKGAIANNVNVGVYFFSMAKDENEALEEAKWLVEQIKDYDISYPVAIDIEIFDRDRLTGVSASQMTENALVFCNYVRSKGYTPMIYSYMNALTKKFDTAKFGNERIWLAQYNDVVTYKGKYHMWQYTSSGSVPGISGRVDMNVAYFSVTNDVTKREVVNGVTIVQNEDTVDFIPMNMKTKLTKDVTLRSSPYLNYPNKAGILNKDSNITVTGMGEDFVRILYDDNVFYVNDTDCFELVLNDVSFIKAKMDVKVTKQVEVWKRPYNFLKDNVYKELEVDSTVLVTGLNKDYVRIEIDDKEYFVNDIEFYEVIKDYGLGSSGKSNS
ncbi:MAG: glycoside hydrolase family 25 protein [Bacilli bacterium]|nr:glycoside hydrolase family 25 protein [Bacilli bacterium]